MKRITTQLLIKLYLLLIVSNNDKSISSRFKLFLRGNVSIIERTEKREREAS